MVVMLDWQRREGLCWRRGVCGSWYLFWGGMIVLADYGKGIV